MPRKVVRTSQHERAVDAGLLRPVGLCAGARPCPGRQVWRVYRSGPRRGCTWAKGGREDVAPADPADGGLHDHSRQLDRQRGRPVHRRRAARQRGRARARRLRLHPRLCRSAGDRRPAWKHLRLPTRLLGWPGVVQPWIACVRAGPRRGGADPGTDRPGNRRGDHGAAGADRHPAELRGHRSGKGACYVSGRARRRGRSRSGPRRRAHLLEPIWQLLAPGLSCQCPSWGCALGACAGPPSRRSRPSHRATRRDGCRDADARIAPAGRAAHART